MKKLFGIIAIAAIATIAGWNFNNNEIKLSDLALANVNALADKEDDGISRPCPYEGGCFIVSIDDDVWIKSGYQKNKPTK